MIKKCKCCGKEFNANCSKYVFCSHECSNAYKKAETTRRILEHYDANIGSGKTYTELAKEFGQKNSSRYQSICRENGRQKPLTKLQAEVKKGREQGQSIKEIAGHLGKEQKQIASVAKALGMAQTQEEIERNKEEKRARQVSPEDKVRQIIYDKSKGRFTYESGYTGRDNCVSVKCTSCGKVMSKSMTTLRQTRKTARCEYCYRQEVESTHKQQQIERVCKRIKHSNTLNAYEIYEHRCTECGRRWHDESRKHTKYCSDVCRHRAKNRRRDKRINEYNLIDNDITLLKLFNRDKGICYICGRTCDWNDNKTINGAFVVGGGYPTIEHIRPLCRGGEHSWDNIRLACHRCNTKKGTKYAPHSA